ncbi:MAG: histidine kinase [Bacteroidota bacterium]
MDSFSRLILLAFVLNSFAYGQLVTPVYRHFTEEKGMSTNRIREVSQDEEGFIWLFSEKGLERFDGSEFQLFKGNPKEYSYQELVQKLKPESLFLVDKELSLFSQDTSQAHPMLEQVNAVRQGAHHMSVYVDSNRHVWFTMANMIGNKDPKKRFTTLYELTPDTLIHHDLLTDPTAQPIGAKSYWKEIDGQPIYTGRQVDMIINPARIKIEKNIPYSPDKLGKYVKRMIRLKDGSYLSTGSGNLSHFDSTRIYFSGENFLPYVILDLYEDRQGSVWISTYGGVYCVDQYAFDQVDKYQHYLPEYTITSLLEDKDGGLWFGTKDHGLFHMINPDIRWLRWPEKGRKNNIISLLSDEDRLWYSASDGHLYYVDSTETLSQHSVPISKNGFAMVKFGEQILTSYRYLISDQSWTLIRPLTGEPNSKFGYFFHLIVPKDERRFWISNRDRGLFEIDLDEHAIVYDSRDHGFGGRIQQMTLSPSEELWMTKNGNLWRLEDSVILHPYEEYPELEGMDSLYYFLRTHFTDAGKAFFMALDSGIFIYNEHQIQRLIPGEHIPNARSWGIEIENEDSVWILSHHEFTRFVYDKDEKKYVRSESFNPTNILPPATRYRAIFHQNRLWLGTDNGLVHFNHQNFLSKEQESPSSIYFAYLESKDSVYLPDKAIRLSHRENNFSIAYRAVSLLNRDQLSFRYRIPGVDPNWEYTEQTNIRYTNLDPGTYTFELESSDEQGEFRGQIQRLTFEIIPHFTQTLWFAILVGLLVVIGLAFIVKQIIVFFMRQNNNKRQLTELKYQALIGQMSPHFIFNALNSISFLIKNQQSSLANNYLSRFGGLLRGVLEHSQHTFVPLSEEIEHLRHYLELERLQMGTNLDIDFYIDSTLLEREVFVPPMLFQPAIENALKHGISPKGKGELLVHFLESEDQILVAIRDDGVGREAASKQPKTYISKKKHSIGVQNTQERISTIKRMYNVEIGMRIEDLEDNGESQGTQVEFYFPKLYQSPTQVANHPILDRISRL